VELKRRAAWPALLATAALAAAGCTVSTSDGKAASPTTAATAAASTGAAAPGVTKDTIKLGYAAVDFARIKASFGVDAGNAPPEAMQALVDATNEAGGINGRKVELVVRTFLPVGQADAEKACRELIEDEKVFAVLGTFIGDTALCVTETHATPYFGNYGLSPARKARSKAPFIVTGFDDAKNLGDGIQLLLDEGALKGRTVAVLSDQERDEASIDELVVAPLEAAGVDVVSKGRRGPTSSDAVQGAAEMDRILQRFHDDGADTVIVTTGLGGVVPAFGRTAYHPKVVFVGNGQIGNAEPLTKWGLTDPASLDGAIGAVFAATSPELAADPLVKRCFRTIDEHSDLDLQPTDVYSAAERPGAKGVALVVQMCELWRVVEKVLAKAGPNPTADSLVAGLDDVGPIPLVLGRTGHLSSTRWNAASGSRLWKYDRSQLRFVPDGAPS
jgi:ABC-type branched-subunit amino acid transport system substrate-binding protein